MRIPSSLQLEFPDYHIAIRVIGDKMFYIAEAVTSDVQPRFAQAETMERLQANLRAREADFKIKRLSGNSGGM